jgi:RNA polymerase primary sigma factor
MRPLKINQRITSRDSESIDNYFQEVSSFKLLTDEEEVELANKVAKGDKRALNRLVEANLRFVISVAKQYQNQGVSLEDLINEGNIGLIKAAERFDNNRGFKFISYAVWWIRQSIMQSISEHSRLIRIPNNQSISVQKVNRVIAKLEQDLEREPTEEEISEILKDTDIKVREVLNIGGRVTSLDAPVKEGEDMVYLDYVPNKNIKKPDESFKVDSLQHDIKKVLDGLDKKHRAIICMYFGLFGFESMTLEEIGERVNLTRERVRQIKDSALRVLKCRHNSSILKEHFEND